MMAALGLLSIVAFLQLASLLRDLTRYEGNDQQLSEILLAQGFLHYLHNLNPPHDPDDRYPIPIPPTFIINNNNDVCRRHDRAVDEDGTEYIIVDL